MPEELFDAALQRRLVIFAGAGISTESRRAIGDTFAGRIALEMGREEPATFPKLMSEYEARFGRRQLLQRIRERFEYLHAFRELEQAATRFHREVATAFFLDEIVTTNWDTYFEDYAAAIPMVVPADYAFADLRGRKVFKLHGSMHNLGTIVATEADYRRCYSRLRTGTLGATFKHLLATKSVVFVGYSFGDSDLSRILRFMRRELGALLPRSYVVTPHGYTGDDFPEDRIIKTDGTYFVTKLKQLAVDRGAMRPNSVYDVVANLHDRVVDARLESLDKTRPDRHPAVIYSWSYQDGLLHALERINALRSSGFYSDPRSVSGTLHSYEHARRGAIRKRNYWDAAYIEGYQNGLTVLEVDAEAVEGAPLYFVWGSKSTLLTFAEFRSALKKASTLHKTATRRAERILAEFWRSGPCPYTILGRWWPHEC